MIRNLSAALLLTAFVAGSVFAQTAPIVPDAPAQLPEPPAKLPKPERGDRIKNLDFLFEALKVAPDPRIAKGVEDRIWALWFVSGSSTTDLLMSRVKQAFDSKEYDLAIQLLDAVVQIKPEYIEAWNRRATVHFLNKNFGQSLADLQQVLAREPRHFGAWSGLGLILQEFGDEKRALDAYRRALALHPHLPKVPDTIKALSEKVEGRDI